MTKQAFENAIAVTSALGGSTNAVLHLLAIANEAGVELHLDDFNRIAAKVPHIADMKPGGKFHMSDLDRVGGVPVVMRHLLEAGLLHGDVLTVTGKTMAENLAAIDPPAPDGVVVYPLDRPIHSEGGINVLTGSLAPKGSVVKVAGLTKDQMAFEGAARVFDGEDAAMEAILSGSIQPGTVLVIRYEGPKGGPGMREMLAITGALERCGSRRRLRARHRRPLQRWHVGLLHRPRRAGSGRRRSDRVRRRRRRDPRRRAQSRPRPARRRRRTGPPPAGLGAPAARATRAACSASTRSWCRAQRRARSPTSCSARISPIRGGSGVEPSPTTPRLTSRPREGRIVRDRRCCTGRASARPPGNQAHGRPRTRSRSRSPECAIRTRSGRASAPGCGTRSGWRPRSPAWASKRCSRTPKPVSSGAFSRSGYRTSSATASPRSCSSTASD